MIRRNPRWTRFLPALAALCATLAATGGFASARRPVLVVGWHDEMNTPGDWQPLGGVNEPQLFAARPGALTLRMPQAPEGFPYDYQWGGATRRASVDLGRYPILVASVSDVHDGSYAHLDVEEQDVDGRPVRTLRTPTLRQPGLTLVDAGEAWGAGTRRLHVRLIVGGSLSGAACEYAWVRFIRREDLPRLQGSGSPQEVLLRP